MTGVVKQHSELHCGLIKHKSCSLFEKDHSQRWKRRWEEILVPLFIYCLYLRLHISIYNPQSMPQENKKNLCFAKRALHRRVATKQHRNIVSFGYKTYTIWKFKFPEALNGKDLPSGLLMLLDSFIRLLMLSNLFILVH